MLSTIIKWSIARRWLVIIAAALVTVWIVRIASQMPVDVFPNFAPPQVEIQTEAPGLAPEEVESLVTLPIESAINGTPGVTTVRSSSAVSISVVKVIFDWGTDIYQARQLVTERLQLATNKLPQGVEPPQISPISSPIGTVIKYAFTVDGETRSERPLNPPTLGDFADREPPLNSSTLGNFADPVPPELGARGQLNSVLQQQPQNSLMEVRRIVDWQVTNRLLAVPGVSQVVVFGGDVRQYQVLIDPAKLTAFDISWQEVTEAVQGANSNAPGGYLTNFDTELLIRGVGRIASIEDLKQSVITARNGIPITLADVADVQIGAAPKRGDASLNGQKAIILIVNKQPLADTPTVTRAVEDAIADLKLGLPKNIKITVTFRQEDFIEASIDNIRSALIEGSIIVSLILIPFLMDWRTLVVSLTALPLSLLLGLLALHWLGQGLNTMTLGGLAVAIGSAVDDAIVDAENVHRSLRENKFSSQMRSPLQVVFTGCQEVRDSLFGATLITVVQQFSL